jgi:hypothetical protein
MADGLVSIVVDTCIALDNIGILRVSRQYPIVSQTGRTFPVLVDRTMGGKENIALFDIAPSRERSGGSICNHSAQVAHIAPTSK